MKKFWILLGLFLSSASLHAGSLLLINDTGFKLVAVIHANDGTIVGTETIAPFTSLDWSDDLYSTPLQQKPFTETPYTVMWYCEESNTPYSTCGNLGQSANVAAQECPGTLSCPRKKDKKNAN